MYILALNCGSSSVKMEAIDPVSQDRFLQVSIKGILSVQPSLEFSDEVEPRPCPAGGHVEALRFVLPLIQEKLAAVELMGIVHRVVHGGETFQEPTLITDQVVEAIRELAPLAPLHNPIQVIGIEACLEQWADLPQVAVFDTAFHSTLPTRAKLYALPKSLNEKHGLRRYGFHGTSHRYVARKAAEYLGFEFRDLRIITCHLGNGASLCAVEYGRSVETSMGMTPLEGLVMGTRSGDVDPGVLMHLMGQEHLTPGELDILLNQDSGLKGLAGTNDMQELEERSANGDDAARRAIQVFTHRLRKYIGSFAAVMGGVDAIVFTGGIGENSAVIRERTAQRMEFLGAILDEDANRMADRDDPKAIADFSTANSRCKLLVVPTDEQYEMVRQAASVIQEHHKVHQPPLTIPIAVSARHVHLTREIVDQLFGEGYELTLHRWLSQPGQFAAKEQVNLIGPKNTLERVRILGPLRSKNQVEISRTDEFFLGIDAPIRASGHVENSPGITLEGPKGRITIQEGVICALRHIHMTLEDAEQFGVHDKDMVEVRVDNEHRSLTFGSVLVRVSPKYKLEMHIDTDEGNAAELGRGAVGALVETIGTASILRRQLNKG
ncbi:MAG: acetate/propionate family kinase [Bacteroidota bacterium]